MLHLRMEIGPEQAAQRILSFLAAGVALKAVQSNAVSGQCIDQHAAGGALFSGMNRT